MLGLLDPSAQLTLWTRNNWGAWGPGQGRGLGIPMMAHLCQMAWGCPSPSFPFVPALVRGTMESLRNVRALELQLQVRGGEGSRAGHTQLCQAPPSWPLPARATQSGEESPAPTGQESQDTGHPALPAAPKPPGYCPPAPGLWFLEAQEPPPPPVGLRGAEGLLPSSAPRGSW